MLWLILDENNTATLLVENDRVYPIIDVVNQNYSTNSLDCDDAEDDRSVISNSFMRSTVSRMMVEQFFEKVDQPVWPQENFDIFVDDDC